MNLLFKKLSSLIIISIAVIVFVILKSPYLALPYYWDEAWSYSNAVYMMYQNGPSLLPDTLPSDISRGHPLLFYFLSSGWMTLINPSVVSVHIFCLIISLTLLYSIFFFCKKLFNETVAIIAVVLTMIQEVFFVQSSLLLPEVMVALFSIWVIFAYFDNRKLFYIVSGSLLLYTKESGVVLILAIIAWDFLSILKNIKLSKTAIYEAIKQHIFIIAPLAIAAIYFIAQKIMLGWYFFPDHIGLIDLDWWMIKYKAGICYQHIFMAQGRKSLLCLTILLFVGSLILYRKKYSSIQIKMLLFFVFFTLCYLGFSVVNFLSNRYLLLPIILFCITGAFIIQLYRHQYKYVSVIVLVMIFGWSMYKIKKSTSNGDDSIGYADMVKAHLEMTHYMEEQHMQDKILYTHFLMGYNLRNKSAGYLHQEEFGNIVYGMSDEVDYLLLSSIEYDKVYDEVKKNTRLKLIKSIRKTEQSWVELYEVIH